MIIEEEEVVTVLEYSVGVVCYIILLHMIVWCGINRKGAKHLCDYFGFRKGTLDSCGSCHQPLNRGASLTKLLLEIIDPSPNWPSLFDPVA